MGRSGWIGAVLATALFVVGAATEGSPAAAVPGRAGPVVEGVSPPAVHAGDDVLIRARRVGRGRPHVWIGGHRVRRIDVRVDRVSEDADVDRVWARVPKRTPAGSHEVRLATRAGTAVAAN